MTLTEEQRPTAGFDLEKARDVEKAMSPMPWIVLEEAHGEMIIIRNPNHPMYIDGIVAWGRVAEANTPDAIGIAYMRENFSNLIGEIERLRASLIDLHAEADQRAARIQELEDALKVEKAWVRQYQKWLVEEVAEGMSENGFADDDLRQKARDSLILDGKIEPDADAKPHCWQITDERKAALLRAYDIVSWIDRADSDNKLHITAILGMIKEAEAGQE